MIRAKIRHYLSRAVCFVLGHSMVDVSAVWAMQRGFLDKGTEAVCVRCFYQEKFTFNLAENVFADSPLLKRMRSRQQ